MRMCPRSFVRISAVSLTLLGCSKDKPREQSAPPPVAKAANATCAPDGRVSDPVSATFFPSNLPGYCLDAATPTRSFGERARSPREEICTTLFDGECEIYFRHKLTRVVAIRYIDDANKGSTIDVNLSTYADPSWAYAMFTRRVVPEADPADESAPRTIPSGGASALGTGRAYLWKAQYLAEIQYNNENELQAEIAKNSAPVLTALVTEMGEKLPGSSDKPPSARALPTANLVHPNAVSYSTNATFGIAGLGPGAVGYYRDGTKRFRVAALAAEGEAKAQVSLKTLGGRPGAMPLTNVGDEGLLVVLGTGAGKTEWAFARKGSLVLGVGDEEYATKRGDPPEKAAEARLSKDEKVARLRALSSGPSIGASTPSIKK